MFAVDNAIIAMGGVTMESFDFAFTLFGLVLGLAMAEVLAGFVRVLKARSKAPGEILHIRVGWLTPALGAIVIIDLVTTWMLAWQSRGGIAVDYRTMLGGTAATTLYFIAASLVWPDEPARWPDLDEWFDLHKGQIGGAVAIANLGFSLVSIVVAGATSVPTMQVIYIGSAAALIFTRRRWQSMIAVGSMAALMGYLIVNVVMAAISGG